MEAIVRKDATLKRDRVIISTDLLEIYESGGETFLFTRNLDTINSIIVTTIQQIGIGIKDIDVDEEGMGEGNAKVLFQLDGFTSIKSLSELLEEKKGVLSYNEVGYMYSTLSIIIKGLVENGVIKDDTNIELNLDNIVVFNNMYFFYGGVIGGIGGGVGGAAAGGGGGSEGSKVFIANDSARGITSKWIRAISLLCGYCLTGNELFLNDGSGIDSMKDTQIKRRVQQQRSSRQGINVALQMIEDTRLYFALTRAYSLGVYLLL